MALQLLNNSNLQNIQINQYEKILILIRKLPEDIQNVIIEYVITHKYQMLNVFAQLFDQGKYSIQNCFFCRKPLDYTKNDDNDDMLCYGRNIYPWKINIWYCGDSCAECNDNSMIKSNRKWLKRLDNKIPNKFYYLWKNNI